MFTVFVAGQLAMLVPVILYCVVAFGLIVKLFPVNVPGSKV